MPHERPIDDDTETLTRAIARGDTAAFARLYDRTFDDLLSAALRETRRDESFCLDVVQSTFMKVIRSIPPLQCRAQLDTWLRTTMLRTALDTLRSERRRTRRETSTADRATESPTPDHNAQHDLVRWLESRLAQLDPDEANLLIARYRFGRTLERIGADLGLRPGAVHARIARLLARLRAAAREDAP